MMTMRIMTTLQVRGRQLIVRAKIQEVQDKIDEELREEQEADKQDGHLQVK